MGENVFGEHGGHFLDMRIELTGRFAPMRMNQMGSDLGDVMFIVRIRHHAIYCVPQ